MKKLTKILVLLLSVALVCAGLIIAVSADNGTPGATYVNSSDETKTTSSLSEAFTNAKEGTTITLTGNTAVDAAEIAINKTVTLDLAGYTLTNEQSIAFVANTDGKTFTIQGGGSIKNTHTLIYNSTACANLIVNLIGDENAPILVDTTNACTSTASDAFAYYSGGTVNVKNVEITATTSNRGKVFNSPNGTSAKVNFVGVKLNQTHTHVDDNTQLAAFIYVPKQMVISVKNCEFTSNTNVFLLETQSSRFTDTFITIDSSYIKASTNYTSHKSGQIGIFASYSKFYCDIVVNNSYLSGSYRPILLEALGEGKVILNNSTLNHTSLSAAPFASKSHIVLNEGSALTYAFYKNTELISTSGWYITFNEGSRVDANVYKAMKEGGKTARTIFSDDSVPFTSDTFEFIYDPAGNPDAPYVVVDKGTVGANLEGNVFYSANGFYNYYDSSKEEYQGNDLYEGVIWTAGTFNREGKTGKDHTLVPYDVYLGWNKAGVISGVYLNNSNPALKLEYTEAYPASKPTVVSWVTAAQGSALTFNNYPVMVYSVDFATDSVFPSGKFGLNVRNATGGGGGALATKINLTSGSESVSLESMTNGASDVTLNLNSWNNITVVVIPTLDQAVDAACDGVADKAAGTAYYYLNGTLLGTSTAHAKGGGMISDLRWDTVKDDTYGTSIIFDNYIIRTFGNETTTTTTTTTADDGTETTTTSYVFDTDYTVLSPESYLLNGGKALNTGRVANDNITVGYTSYNTANEALVAGAELGILPQLNGNVSNALVTENGSILTNGYTLTTNPESFPSIVQKDEDGNSYLIIFDESMGYVVNYKFYIGEKGNADQMADEAYYKTFECGVGVVPVDLYVEVLDSFDVYDTESNHYLTRDHVGWSVSSDSATSDEALTTALSLEYAEAHADETVTVYPAYCEPYQFYAWVITDLDGNFKRGWKTDSIYGSDWSERGKDSTGTGGDGTGAIKLNYGEIWVLQKNISYYAHPQYSKCQDSAIEDKTFAIDLNGHTLTSTVKTNIFATDAAGEKLYVYSSRPGAKVKTTSTKSSGVPGGGAMFFLANGNEESVAAQESTETNTHIYVGSVTLNSKSYDGANLTMYGDCLIDARTGDSTCSFNMEGATFVHTSKDYGAIVFPRFYNGSINLKDSNIIMTADSSTSNVIRGADAGDGAKCTVNIDGCAIIMYENGKDVIDIPKAISAVNISNTVTNGRIGNAITTVGENVYAHSFTSAVKVAEGLVVAKYNVGMDVSAFTSESVLNTVTQTASGTVASDVPYVIAPYGYEGEADLILPLFGQTTTAADKTVTVTWSGLGTNAAIEETYLIGGNVVADAVPDIEDCALTSLKLVHDGGFAEEFATNIQADATYTPTYSVAANITGIKANLSLYADFNVNLYIPGEHKANITFADGLEAVDVTLTEGDYVKVTLTQKCNNAADNVTFAFTIKEGDYSKDVSVSINIVDYASKILEGATYTDADKVLMYYMLNYANEAEYYIENMYNESVKTCLESFVTAGYDAKYTVDESYSEAIADITNLSGAFKTATVDISGTPAFLLTLKEGFAGTVTVTYGGNTSRYEVAASDTETTIALTDMKVYNFGTVLNITAEGNIGEENVSVSGKYSLDTFVKYHVDNAANTESETQAASRECLNLLKALHAYAEVSEAYKQGTLLAAEAE